MVGNRWRGDGRREALGEGKPESPPWSVAATGRGGLCFWEARWNDSSIRQFVNSQIQQGRTG